MFFLKFYFRSFLVWSEELQVNGYCATHVINPKHSCGKHRDFNRNSKHCESISESEQSNVFNDFELLSPKYCIFPIISLKHSKFYGISWRNMCLHGATTRPYVLWNVIYQFHYFVWIFLGFMDNLCMNCALLDSKSLDCVSWNSATLLNAFCLVLLVGPNDSIVSRLLTTE